MNLLVKRVRVETTDAVAVTAASTASAPAAAASTETSDDTEEVPDEVRLHEPGWKDRYYRTKFHLLPEDVEAKKAYVLFCLLFMIMMAL